jgi:hypothetical protein
MQNKMKLKSTIDLEELPADADETNVTRQVKNACFSYVTPQIPSNPSSTFFGGSCSTPFP